MTGDHKGGSDPLWYKDCIIYQVHVKSFYDANADGVGDFQGLTRKLNYIQELGVDCIWILPFYPSPLQDDGYDIADYESVNPIYGDLTDFKKFLDEAHKRGIKVITELVINHTSNQHAWFQAARNAPAGSKERDFYVWSDTDQKFKETRIVFCDTEASNWTWDPVAKAFYWHRFFHHQPDLNFDNPEVFQEVVRIMDTWLAMGVDGMRLDAVSYLIEREGVDCAHLPETHQVLKNLRSELDKRYQNKVFLGEANGDPEVVREYFGDGDECHMAFHFPLMTRIYLAIYQEDHTPIVDIMQETPNIPPLCQWAIFLRNHDELTLEMVTDQERIRMYEAYAPDPRMIVNLGIRRRLASLMGYNRAKIELMNCLLFSLPGTPIVYYGDEIGMGDNIWLKDRDGVRTPMQWSSDANAGFSKAPYEKLFCAPIMDPVSGFQSVNVESQQLNQSSLLSWMKSIIATRRKHKIFGRGTIEFLEVSNRKILAFLRKYENETLLVAANLSGSPQACELDLSQFAGRHPRELIYGSEFPPIGENPYMLTFSGYGFYWLLL